MCNNPCQICGDADDCEILQLSKSISTLPLLNQIKSVERIRELLSQHSCTFEKKDFEVFNGSVKK